MKILPLLIMILSFDVLASFRPKFTEIVSLSNLNVLISASSENCADDAYVRITGYEGWNEVGPLVYVEVLDVIEGATLFSAVDDVPNSLEFCAKKSNLNSIKVNWFHGTGGSSYRLRTLSSIKP